MNTTPNEKTPSRARGTRRLILVLVLSPVVLLACCYGAAMWWGNALEESEAHWLDPFPTPSWRFTRSVADLSSLPAITPENASRVVEIARWSRYTLEPAQWSADGQSLFVGVTQGPSLPDGLLVYDARTLAQERLIGGVDAGWAFDASPDNETFAAQIYEGQYAIGLWRLSSGLYRTLRRPLGFDQSASSDDDRLDTLFLALPIAWRGTLTQYAGRLHRLNQTKKEVIIYDYVDVEVPVLARMHAKRRAGYKAIGYELVQQDKSQARQLSLEDL